MEKREVEKCSTTENTSHLNRNRSFKTKQLVRSQAIRESTSPPRTVSPSIQPDRPRERENKVNVKVTSVDRSDSGSSQDEEYSERKPVEIQITQGSWETNSYGDGSGTGRGARWPSDGRESHLLSNNPRVACICGACAACPHCRGRRRRYMTINKQDSGIGVDECADYDSNGVGEIIRKASSLDVEEYCRCPERRDRPRSALTRNDSDEKSEPMGPELVSFLSDTLNKSAKDRGTLLKIERELHALVNDTGRCIVKFPVMTSYGRMLVHRCAALFQLSHHIDQYNKNCVIVSKVGTSGGRIPCTSFKAWCVAAFPPASPQRADPVPPASAKSILKREGAAAAGRGGGAAVARSKSLEQREQDYERTRRRIFSQEESPWPWLHAGPVKLLTPPPGRNKLLKVQSLETASPAGWRRGPPVPKSHSFQGYSPPRALSRQGDLASSSWRLSPSSSGYKTLSLRSTDSVTPSPTGGGTPEPAGGPAGGAVVWCVTDMARVPPGVTVIHPQTGRPLTNPDGSVYRFDPDNPPLLYDAAQTQHQAEAPEKRRGRLEKQHSFIDHSTEAECPPTEQYQYEYEIQENEETNAEKDCPECPRPPSPPEAPAPAPTAAESGPPEALGPRADPPHSHTYHGTVYYSPVQTQAHYTEEGPAPAPQYAEAPHGKVTPHELNNLRPVALGGASVVYGAGAGPYYVQHPHYRLETVAPLYGAVEEQKIPTPPDNTFRIDASYPYPPLEYGYVEPHAPLAPLHRGYSLGYSNTPPPALPPYVGRVLPYALGGGWGSPLAPLAPQPLVYPHLAPNNALLYPQMVPQYGACASVFAPPAPPSADELGARLAHIRHATPAPPTPAPAPAPAPARNNGHGILGRYPTNTTDSAQLSSAARAIVHSIRQLQASSTYHSQQERRYEPGRPATADRRRPAAHSRPPAAHGRPAYAHDRYNYQDRTYNNDRNYNDRSNSYADRNSNAQNVQDRNIQNFQDRNSVQDKGNVDRNVQDRNYNVQERNSNVQEGNSNVQERNSNVQERNSNVQEINSTAMDHSSVDRSGNAKDNSNVLNRNITAHDRSSNPQDRSSNLQDRSNNLQEKSSNPQDRSNNPQERSNNLQERSNIPQERSKNLQERSSNPQDRSNNPQEKISYPQDRSNNPHERSSNLHDRSSNPHDRSCNPNDRSGNPHDRSAQHCAQDRNGYERSNYRNYHQNHNSYRQNNEYLDANVERRGNVQDRAVSSVVDRHRAHVHERGAPRGFKPAQQPYRPHYLFRQVAPAPWGRRAPAPLPPGKQRRPDGTPTAGRTPPAYPSADREGISPCSPRLAGMSHPRRAHPDHRNGRRY